MEPLTKRPRSSQGVALADLGCPVLRLESRSNGTEKRILLFSSDRPGVVGKVVFSSNHIHVLNVKKEYRGRGLGELLFRKCCQAIFEDSNIESSSSNSRWCSLEAEEDEKRYGKLVRFYERLGCKVKPLSKITYLGNNHESFRKVPMYFELTQLTSAGSADCNSSFIMLSLRDSTCEEKNLLTRVASKEKVEICLNDKQKSSKMLFSFLRCNVDHDSSSHDELWLIQADNGLYLTTRDTGLTSKSELHCSVGPSFWRISVDRPCIVVLNPTKDSPWSLGHLTIARQKQTVNYVHTMHKANFLTPLTLWQALERACTAKDSTLGKRGSLQSRCFGQAEKLRQDGHPDWLQLLGLLQYLPRIVSKEAEYDWTLTDETWEVTKGIWSWTCQEYLYNMLKSSQIPEEGINLVRFCKLSTTKECGGNTSSLMDDFSKAISSAHVSGDSVFSREACHDLWDSYYKDIAAKYALDGILLW